MGCLEEKSQEKEKLTGVFGKTFRKNRFQSINDNVSV